MNYPRLHRHSYVNSPRLHLVAIRLTGLFCELEIVNDPSIPLQ